MLIWAVIVGKPYLEKEEKNMARRAKKPEKDAKSKEKKSKTKVSKSTALVGPPTSVPSYLKGEDRTEGFEQYDPSRDTQFPRIEIAQRSSGVIDKGRVELGQPYNTLTGEALPSPFLFTPLMMFKTRTLWHEFGSGQGIRCMSTNLEKPTYGEFYGKHDCAACPFGGSFKPKGREKMPPCKEAYNYLGFAEQNFASPVMITMRSTSFKAGKRLISLAATKEWPLRANIFRLGARDESFDAGSAFVWEVEFEGVLEKKDYETVTEAFRSYERLGTQKLLTPSGEDNES